MSAEAPLRFPRLINLFTTFAFATAGLGLAIFALVQGNDQKNFVKKAAAPEGIDASVDISNVVDPGYVVAVACGLILISTGFSFLTLLAAPALNARLLKLEFPVLLLETLFLFAILIPFTDRVANKSSTVSATAGGQPIPAGLIIQLGQALGIQNVYHKIGYLLNATIVPWIAFLFAAIQTALSFLASRRVANATPFSPQSASSYTEKKELTDKKDVDSSIQPV